MKLTVHFHVAVANFTKKSGPNATLSRSTPHELHAPEEYNDHIPHLWRRFDDSLKQPDPKQGKHVVHHLQREREEDTNPFPMSNSVLATKAMSWTTTDRQQGTERHRNVMVIRLQCLEMKCHCVANYHEKVVTEDRLEFLQHRRVVLGQGRVLEKHTSIRSQKHDTDVESLSSSSNIFLNSPRSM
ncbi:hypothetical protein EYF80_019604 [Liparis tanakae]|uniref:Uncharacterized protein n=1 Tax=Liparis tanakae TaxID=230148 RepID=A0A4Z2HYM4_9TELE|nr:hypothetical protein EYF80_019604 [Liparis tanakae]